MKKTTVTDFMKEELGISVEDVKSLRREYHDQYGTTLAGLVVRKLCSYGREMCHVLGKWI